jgi:3-hydroxyacyl-CoA dehydrogenase
MAGESIRRVAAIGTGMIGASWAAVFLARGLTVAASDPAPEPSSRCDECRVRSAEAAGGHSELPRIVCSNPCARRGRE